MKPRLSLIAAVADNGVIGDAGGLPWRLSTDQRRFKALTMGKPIIMGRRTFASIGRPLPGRTNIVVGRRPSPGDVVNAASLDEALAKAAADCAATGADEIMVIGGGALYAATIGLADRLYITHVRASPQGDTHFPPIDPARWRLLSREKTPAGEKDSHPTEFVIYDRIAAAAAGGAD